MLSVQDFTWLFLGTLLFSGLSGPVLPMIDANALEVLGGDRARYGLMRRWGSFGYMLAVIITGQLGGRLGILAILQISGLALLVAGLLAWSYGSEERSSMPNHQESSRPWWIEVGVSWRSIVHLPGMTAFLLAGFLGWFAATTYYNFFTIFADSLGMSEGLIGLAWGIGIVSEIVMLSLSSRLLARLGAKTLFAVGLLAAALRWSLYAVVQNAYLILGLQALHGFTFGLLHAGAVTYLHTRVAPERRSGAQALWASITTGVAGVTGAYILGPLSDIIGLRTTFAVSGVLAIIGALIGWFGLRQVDESVTTL
jgi:PPP family 3-phenylpropionic acid transporter